jgi:hypothetical protein
MLTPALRAAVCDNKDCAGTCQMACASFAESSCKLDQHLQEDICGSR